LRALRYDGFWEFVRKLFFCKGLDEFCVRVQAGSIVMSQARDELAQLGRE
jgi:hypothetical protein